MPRNKCSTSSHSWPCVQHHFAWFLYFWSVNYWDVSTLNCFYLKTKSGANFGPAQLHSNSNGWRHMRSQALCLALATLLSNYSDREKGRHFRGKTVHFTLQWKSQFGWVTPRGRMTKPAFFLGDMEAQLSLMFALLLRRFPLFRSRRCSSLWLKSSKQWLQALCLKVCLKGLPLLLQFFLLHHSFQPFVCTYCVLCNITRVWFSQRKHQKWTKTLLKNMTFPERVVWILSDESFKESP